MDNFSSDVLELGKMLNQSSVFSIFPCSNHMPEDVLTENCYKSLLWGQKWKSLIKKTYYWWKTVLNVHFHNFTKKLFESKTCRLREIHAGHFVQHLMQSKTSDGGDSFFLFARKSMMLMLPFSLTWDCVSTFSDMFSCCSLSLGVIFSPILHADLWYPGCQRYAGHLFFFSLSIILFFPHPRLHSTKWRLVYIVGIFTIISRHTRQCLYSSLMHPAFIPADVYL